MPLLSVTSTVFQSTPPVKAATVKSIKYCTYSGISIHAAREGGDEEKERESWHSHISIHAAREGGDLVKSSPAVPTTIFQSTPPVKAATQQVDTAERFKQFQSTPPVKAATRVREYYAFPDEISIHAAREGGDVLDFYEYLGAAISIHAAREGGDGGLFYLMFFSFAFQSTPPVKAATPTTANRKIKSRISIHAAREGGDCAKRGKSILPQLISIHAAREGGDPKARFILLSHFNFNPRRP